jgi:hypothetical protein
MTPIKYPCFRRDSRSAPWSATPPRSILDLADRIVERLLQLRLAREQITERELQLARVAALGAVTEQPALLARVLSAHHGMVSVSPQNIHVGSTQ